jgi:hypothetical protein
MLTRVCRDSSNFQCPNRLVCICNRGYSWRGGRSRFEEVRGLKEIGACRAFSREFEGKGV